MDDELSFSTKPTIFPVNDISFCTRGPSHYQEHHFTAHIKHLADALLSVVCSCIFRLCKCTQHAILTSAFPTCLLTEMFEGTITRDNWLTICKCNGTWYQTGSLQCLTATFQIFIQIYSMNIHWHTFKYFFLEFWKKGSSDLTLSPKYPPPQIPSILAIGIVSMETNTDCRRPVRFWYADVCSGPRAIEHHWDIKADISYWQTQCQAPFPLDLWCGWCGK